MNNLKLDPEISVRSSCPPQILMSSTLNVEPLIVTDVFVLINEFSEGFVKVISLFIIVQILISYIFTFPTAIIIM